MNLLQNSLTNSRSPAMHGVNTQRKARQPVGLIKKRNRKIQRARDLLNVFVRWSSWQKAVFDTRVMPLSQAGLVGDLFLTRAPIMPREKQKSRIECSLRHFSASLVFFSPEAAAGRSTVSAAGRGVGDGKGTTPVPAALSGSSYFHKMRSLSRATTPIHSSSVWNRLNTCTTSTRWCP